MIKTTQASKTDIADPLSYNTIKNTLYDWRHAGSKYSTWNNLDVPGHLFFKIVFHFFNGDAYNSSTNGALQNGLLAPTWDLSSNVVDDSDNINSKVNKLMSQQYGSTPKNNLNPDVLSPAGNSAYNFLVRNDELERAEKLKQFITLLSSVSTYSPWYFLGVEGLGDVLERSFHTGEDYKIEDKPKQITINCMPDAEDNRIATLLDLYRDVAFSYTWHREILPANLRRFDMSIYIFSSPIENLHYDGPKSAVMNSDLRYHNSIVPSYKCIELHDCEINYNAIKDGYTGMNNAEGFQQTFNIPITVGDAYEHRYNMYMDRTIGDIVAIDMIRNTYSEESGRGKINKIFIDKPQETSETLMIELKNRVEKYWHGGVNIVKLVDDLTGNVISQTVKSQLLGNIYKTSISDITTNLSQMTKNISSGNIGGVINNAKGISEVKNGWYVKKLGNINTVYNR